MIRDYIVGFLRATGLMPLVTRLSNVRYRRIKRQCERDGKDDLVKIYDEKYFKAETHMTVPTAPTVVDVLMETFNPATVLDVGCGTAVYLAEFQKRGVIIQGLEGSEAAIHTALIDPQWIQQTDLRQPVVLDQKADLVICIEVAEHIDAVYADTVAGSLVQAGQAILFSAAQPGQGGIDHINEQPSSYWIEKFERHGATYDKASTDRIRHEFSERNCVWWLRDNALVFTGRLDPSRQ